MKQLVLLLLALSSSSLSYAGGTSTTPIEQRVKCEAYINGTPYPLVYDPVPSVLAVSKDGVDVEATWMEYQNLFLISVTVTMKAFDFSGQTSFIPIFPGSAGLVFMGSFALKNKSTADVYCEDIP